MNNIFLSFLNNISVYTTISEVKAISTTTVQTGTLIYCSETGCYQFSDQTSNVGIDDLVADDNGGIWIYYTNPFIYITPANQISTINGGFIPVTISDTADTVTYIYYSPLINENTLLFPQLSQPTDIILFCSAVASAGFATLTFSDIPGDFTLFLYIYNPSNLSDAQAVIQGFQPIIYGETDSDLQDTSASLLVNGQIYFSEESGAYYYNSFIPPDTADTLASNTGTGYFIPYTENYIYLNSSNQIVITNSSEYIYYNGSVTNTDQDTNIIATQVNNSLTNNNPTYIQWQFMGPGSVPYSSYIEFQNGTNYIFVEGQSDFTDWTFNYFIFNIF